MEEYFSYLKAELDKQNFKGLGLNSVVSQVSLLNSIVTAPTVQKMCAAYKNTLDSPIRTSCKNYIKQYLNTPNNLQAQILLAPVFLSLLGNTSPILQQSLEIYIKTFDTQRAFEILTFLPIEKEFNIRQEGIDVQTLNSYFYMALLLSCSDVSKSEMLAELILDLKDVNSTALALCRNINNASIKKPLKIKNHIFRFKGKLHEQIKLRQVETYFENKVYKMSIDLGDDVMLHSIAYPHFALFKNEEDFVYFLGRTVGSLVFVEEDKIADTIQFTVLAVGVEDDNFPDTDIYETGVQVWQYSRKAINYNNSKVDKSDKTN